MDNWDDLRIFLAAARAGSLAGGGRALGIDTATVGRRIARLETSMRATLMVRSSGGIEMTAAGARLLKAASDADTAMRAVFTEAKRDSAGGTVRLSAAEGFGTTIIAPALPDLRRQRPGLEIELAANPGFLSPATREVDIAITLSPSQDARLQAEPLADYQLALYAAPGFLARRGDIRSVADLGDVDIVGYVDDFIYAPELRYLDEIGISRRPALASSSIRAQREMIAAGGGVGVLPCFLADGLVRVCRRDTLLTRRWWTNTHRDIADTARIRAVKTWIRKLARDRRAALSPF